MDPLIIPSGPERVTEAEQEVGDLRVGLRGLRGDWLVWLGWSGCSIGRAAKFENLSSSEQIW